MQLQKSLTYKAPQSHSKLHPHVINNIQSKLSVGDTKRDIEKPQNVTAQTESWPKDPILGLAGHRPAFA